MPPTEGHFLTRRGEIIRWYQTERGKEVWPAKKEKRDLYDFVEGAILEKNPTSNSFASNKAYPEYTEAGT